MGGRKDTCGAKRGTSFEAQRWLSLDICGSIGVTLSFSFHIFAFSVIICYLIAGSLISTSVFLLLYIPVFVLALASLFMAWYVLCTHSNTIIENIYEKDEFVRLISLF